MQVAFAFVFRQIVGDIANLVLCSEAVRDFMSFELRSVSFLKQLGKTIIPIAHAFFYSARGNVQVFSCTFYLTRHRSVTQEPGGWESCEGEDRNLTGPYSFANYRP